MNQRTALISVFDKAGIVTFARELVGLNFRIISSGGTATVLMQNGVPVIEVSDYTGFPEMLDGRVKTLHPKIHGGLLALNIASHIEEIRQNGVERIDLVCVDLYPLAREIAKPNATRESIIEMTDIGGPTMLRSAAKGRRIVISHPGQREMVLSWLRAELDFPDAELDKLAATAEYIVARYALLSAEWTSEQAYTGFVGSRVFPTYAENRQQGTSSLYSFDNDDPLALEKFRLWDGSAPGYINLTDIDRLLQTITHIAAGFDLNFGYVPAIALGVKHGNCCGAAVSSSDNPSEAVINMVTGDDLAIFGGVVMTNFPIDGIQAKHLLYTGHPGGKKRIFDTVIAPAVDDEAVELLARKGGKCRILVNPALSSLNRDSLDSAPRFRYVRGGFLKQPNYTFVLQLGDPQLTWFGAPTEQQKKDIVLAWAIGSTSNSNTIAIVWRGQLLGNGVGQQARIYAANLALERVRTGGHEHRLAGAVAYSDSFFPFPDAPKVLLDAGVRTILTSSGSVKDQATIDLCADYNALLLMIPDAVGRGFFGH